MKRYRSVLPMFVSPVLLVALVVLACTVNPLKTANTATVDNKPETIALALYGMYVITEEAAATLKEAPGTPQSVKDALKAADAAGSPAAESLRAGAKDVKAVRDVITTGSGGAANLPAALLKLNNLITTAVPDLQKLTDAYNKAKKPATAANVLAEKLGASP